MDWETVDKLLDEYRNTDTRPTKLYKEDHIFDEDMSVKWNKEIVARLNAELREEHNKRVEARYQLWRKVVDSAITCIIEDFRDEKTTISKTGAERLFNHLYSKFDGDVSDIQDMVYEFAVALGTSDV